MFSLVGEIERYVFPGRFGTPSSHIRLSRHVRDERHHYGIKPFTPNHLRHTISTRMREIGIRPDIVERIIGHHIDGGIIGVYSSYNWLPEMEGLKRESAEAIRRADRVARDACEHAAGLAGQLEALKAHNRELMAALKSGNAGKHGE